MTTEGWAEMTLRYRIDPTGPHRDQPRWLRVTGKLLEAWELWEQISFILIILVIVAIALFKGWTSMHK